ncbi:MULTISPECIES: hypothetical protein [Rhizobium/Agrobacterium group]|uniref:hypothetical protein n=1 Tax=Rhizobium/Agrobacterium group TaxID=227290 RepID=UPI000BE37380|nr:MULTISPECIES: hypothetical protein [Rhizobium/Agrobacterium group]
MSAIGDLFGGLQALGWWDIASRQSDVILVVETVIAPERRVLNAETVGIKFRTGQSGRRV